MKGNEKFSKLLMLSRRRIRELKRMFLLSVRLPIVYIELKLKMKKFAKWIPIYG
jgi:hypothetical protein